MRGVATRTSRHQLYGHLPPITKTIQVRRTIHAGHCWRSRDEFISGPPHMAGQKQDDQLKHTYNSYVRIRDVALKTSQRRWTIGKSGERGSGARHDHDEEYGGTRRLTCSFVLFFPVWRQILDRNLLRPSANSLLPNAYSIPSIHLKQLDRVLMSALVWIHLSKTYYQSETLKIGVVVGSQ